MYFDAAKTMRELRVDPSNRCAALTLPQDCIAILPFSQSQTDIDMDMDMDQAEIDVAR